LSDESRDKGADDAEDRGENETGGIVWSGRQEARDDAGDKTDDDHPENVHSEPRGILARRLAQSDAGTKTVINASCHGGFQPDKPRIGGRAAKDYILSLAKCDATPRKAGVQTSANLRDAEII
jgi:hypothetical protein